MKRPGAKSGDKREKPRKTFPPNWTKFERSGWRLLRALLAFHKLTMPKLDEMIRWEGRSPSLTDVANYRKAVSPELVEVMLDFRDSQDRQCPLPRTVLKDLGGIGGRKPRRQDYNFITALGIDEPAWKASIKKYKGKYLQFTRNEADHVVTAKCDLTGDLASDHSPIYKSSRIVVTRTGTITTAHFLGAYFTNKEHLFLIGSRKKMPDARLSIFDVNFDAEEKQKVLRGAFLGVSTIGSVHSSLCVLMDSAVIGINVQKELWSKPQPRSFFEKHDSPYLREVFAYLFEHEKVDFVTKAMGS
jgi:hypothetical protein